MAGIELDGANQKVVLASDGDTYLEAATDDTIKVYVAGAHDATISANAINVLSGTTLTIDSGATITNSGTANGFSSADPASADGDSLGTASLEWSDLFLADGGIIKFGNDQDTLLTHTDGTGLTLNSTNKLCFNDATQFIQGASGTVLDIAATDEIELTATLIEAVGRLEVTGGAIFNEASADVDFRIESGTQAGKFVVDAGADVICMGTSTVQTIHGSVASVQIDGGTSAAQSKLAVISRVAQSDGACLVLAHTRHATPGSFTILNDNDEIGAIHFAADDGVDMATPGASIVAKVNGTPGGNDMPTELIFSTTADGSNDPSGRLTLDAAGDANFTGNIGIEDDKYLIMGTGDDFCFGLPADETRIAFSRGTTISDDQHARFNGLASNSTTQLDLRAGESKGPALVLLQDQSDDNADLWAIGQFAGDNGANTNLHWTSYTSGSWVNKMRLSTAAVLDVAGAVNASATLDYAEYFEWKTELANDAKITETYGMTVVLDGDKVRLAETGEEAKVLGVVRPTGTSAMVGGSESLAWKHQYEKNVWNETVMEEYTLVKWVEKNADGKITKRHSYHKDRIPAKVLIEDVQLDKSEYNWHTLASNLTSDNLVVPSTDAEKSAANYVERTTYKKDKGEHKKDDKLMRRKINSSYDSTKTYVGREQRRKEWCIVGLLGQVEVRDSAIVPTSWTKMKNLETGIDLYYIK